MGPLGYNYREFVILRMSRGEKEINQITESSPNLSILNLSKLPGESVGNFLFSSVVVA